MSSKKGSSSSSASGGKSKSKNKSSAPNKEISRVFKYLCNYSKKRKYIHLVRKKTARQKKLQAYLRRSDSQPLDATGKPLSMADIDDELASIERQIAEHEEKIDTINRDGLQKITASDLMLALKDLGSVHTKQEVEDMIWEVDEGLDGACEARLVLFQLRCCCRNGIALSFSRALSEPHVVSLRLPVWCP